MANGIDSAFLQELFPADRTNLFFDALFGGAEEGAYDISLSVHAVSADRVELAFDLHQRPGKCLVCSLTYGLPGVFQRHPVINAKGIAAKVAERMGWKSYDWRLGSTNEEDHSFHWIPFYICQK